MKKKSLSHKADTLDLFVDLPEGRGRDAFVSQARRLATALLDRYGIEAACERTRVRVSRMRAFERGEMDAIAMEVAAMAAALEEGE